MSSKTEIICNELERRITAGIWQSGRRIPSFSELTAEFGVSRGVIQYAIRKLSTRGFLYTVQGQGTFVGTGMTQNLRNIVVTMIRPANESSDYQSFLKTTAPIRTQRILSGTQREARANNLGIIYDEIDISDVAGTLQYLNSYKSSDILGMVMLGAITPELRPLLRNVNYPLVLTCDIADQRNSIIRELDIVTDDIHLSGLMATEKLLDAGHRKIRYISARPLIGWSGLFHAGWRSAVAGMGIEISPEDSIELQCKPNQSYYDTGYSFVSRLLDTNSDYTAFFIPEDSLAMGILEGLMDSGVHVPGDISISTVMDTPAYSGRYNLRISGVIAISYHIGRCAVQRIIEVRKYGSISGRHTVVGTWVDGNTIAQVKAE